MAGMLIGCRRQFYDVDFLSEQGRSTTTRRDGPTYQQAGTRQDADGVPQNTGNNEPKGGASQK